MFGGLFGSKSANENPIATGSSSGDNSNSNSSNGSPVPNNERRPLIDEFEAEEQQYGTTSDMLTNSSHHNNNNNNNKQLNGGSTHSNSGRRYYRTLNSSNHNNNGNTNGNGMDNSSHHSASGRSQSLREKFANFKQHSQSSFSNSVRQLQMAIAQHTGSIGMLGSLSIAINNLTGPAMLSLPATFARSGIIPTTLTLIFVSILSALCSLHMANVISKVPLNSTFQQGVEFPEAFRTFWGQRWFIVANILFFTCITVLNVSSLVDNAQVLDTFLGHCNPWGGAWALTVNVNQWNANITRWDPSVCSDKVLYKGGCVPFADEGGEDADSTFLLTAGYVVTAALFFPLALMDLTENVAWQILGFVILLITSLQFIVTFAMSDLDTSHLSWWGDSHADLLGVVLFNFALVITVPAWLYEKEPHVDIPTVMHASTITSTVLYVLIGILGCMAMPGVSDNFLESIMSGALGPAMQIGASIFAFFIIGMNIPLFSILTRLSLMGGGNELRADRYGSQLCSRPVANVLAVYLPFGLSWTLYQGSSVTMLLSWGGMIFTSLVAFLLPLALALYVVQTKFDDCKGSVHVYPWQMSNYLSSKESQVRALIVLLVLSSLAVAIAIVGNIVNDSIPGRDR